MIKIFYEFNKLSLKNKLKKNRQMKICFIFIILVSSYKFTLHSSNTIIIKKSMIIFKTNNFFFCSTIIPRAFAQHPLYLSPNYEQIEYSSHYVNTFIFSSTKLKLSKLDKSIHIKLDKNIFLNS